MISTSKLGRIFHKTIIFHTIHFIKRTNKTFSRSSSYPRYSCFLKFYHPRDYKFRVYLSFVSTLSSYRFAIQFLFQKFPKIIVRQKSSRFNQKAAAPRQNSGGGADVASQLVVKSTFAPPPLPLSPFRHDRKTMRTF